MQWAASAIFRRIPLQIAPEGVPSDLAPKCAKATKVGASWMWGNRYIW
jgi:hypothetical protein